MADPTTSIQEVASSNSGSALCVTVKNVELHKNVMVEEPDDLPAVPRWLPAPPSSSKERNARGQRAIHKMRTRQARSIERKIKMAEKKKMKKNWRKRGCKLCHVFCQSLDTWKAHTHSRGQRHSMQLREKPPPDCEICKIRFPGWPQCISQSHMKGNPQLRAMALLHSESKQIL